MSTHALVVPPDTAEKILRSCIEDGPRRDSIPPGGIADLSVTPFEGTTAFPTYVVRVRWTEGGGRTLFLKTFGSSQLPKRRLGERRERELKVYRDLLDGRELGTAHYYGAMWDDERSRFWLLLEFVDASQLRSLGFDHWVRAAAWLGRMQGTLSGNPPRGSDTELLVSHDAEFFTAMAREALAAVTGTSPALGYRLAAVLEDYDRIIEVMTTQSRTLVHGSYRSQNILVDPTGDRVCPVDWELAAWGSPLYDLAFLCDGFRAPRLHTLWDAYLDQLAAHGGPVPVLEELPRVVECFRLHKQVKSLSDSVRLEFPAHSVAKLVGLAEAMRPGCRTE